MKTHFIRLIALLFLVVLSCRGPEGPQGPTGAPGSGGVESLTDPSIQPKVIDTYPLGNSIGPYLDSYYPQIQVRFNKIMNRALLARSFSLSSPSTSVRIDTSSLSTVGGDVFTIIAVDTLAYWRYHLWRVGNTYTFGVASSARDINGNLLQPAFAMTFTPEPYFRIKSVTPVHGSRDVSPQSSLYIGFNSKVDTSIFSSIQIAPPIPSGRWRLEDYQDSTSLYFYHSGLSSNTLYTITVNTTAHDRDGNHLPQQFVASFRTAGFRIRYTYPSNGSGEVDLTSSIQVACDGRVDTGSVRRAFRISPFIAGFFSLAYQSSAFVFHHNDAFLPETTYAVVIDTALRSFEGQGLVAPYIFSFTTSAFKVDYTSPYDGATDVSRNLSSIYVSFNSSIDTSTVRSAFSIPGVGGTFSMNSYSFSFSPQSLPLPANTTFTCVISTSLRSSAGVRLKSPYSFSFSTGGQ